MRKLAIGFLLVVGAIIAASNLRPDLFKSKERNVLFVNSTAETCSVAVAGETLSVPPKTTRGCMLPVGEYDVKVAGDGAPRTVALKIDRPGTQKASEIWVDLGGKTKYALVNASSLYKGAGFVSDAIVSALQESQGRSGKAKIIWGTYDGAKPFAFDLTGQIELVYPFDRLPKEVALGSSVFKLVPMPGGLKTEADVYRAIAADLTKED
jgi:hypothetical protein